MGGLKSSIIRFSLGNEAQIKEDRYEWTNIYSKQMKYKTYVAKAGEIENKKENRKEGKIGANNIDFERSSVFQYM